MLAPALVLGLAAATQGAEIRAIELDDNAGGAAVTIRSDERLSWTTSFERDGTMLVRLDDARPAPGLVLPAAADGLVSSIALRAESEPQAATSVLITTRGPVASAVIAGDQQLVVRLRPAVRMSLPSTGADARLVTATPCLRARSLPQLNARIVTCLPTGTRVEVVDSAPDWSKVQLPGGEDAWVAERFLAAPANAPQGEPSRPEVPPSPTPPAPAATSEPRIPSGPSSAPSAAADGEGGSDLERLRGERDAANQARADLAAQLLDATRARDELSRQLQDLATDGASPNPALEALVQGLRSENNRLAGRVDELEGANRELAKRIADAGEQQTALREQRDELTTRMSPLEEENAELAARMSALQSEKDDLDTRVGALQREKADLTTRLSALQSEKDDLATRLNALEEQNARLSSRLDADAAAVAAQQDTAARASRLQQENQRLQAQLAARPEAEELERLSESLAALKRSQTALAAELGESRRLLVAEKSAVAEVGERLDATLRRAESAERQRDELASQLQEAVASRPPAPPAVDPDDLARAIAEAQRLALELRVTVDERDALRRRLAALPDSTTPPATAAAPTSEPERLVVPQPPLDYGPAAAPAPLTPSEPIASEELEEQASPTPERATPETAPSEPATRPTPQPPTPEPMAPEPAITEPAADEAVAADSPAPEPPGFSELAEQAQALVAAWAAAWSDQRVDDYLSFYAPGFRPATGMARADWEAQRKLRLARPAFIEVATSDLAVPSVDGESATVTFRQSYRSDTYSDIVRKTLELTRVDDQWKILRETSE